jgi:DNA polymerase-1
MTQLDEGHFHLHSANKAKMNNMNKFFANKNKKMLVDGDLIVYKITSSLEEPIDWGNDIWTLSSDLHKGKQLFLQSIAYYLDLTKSSEAIILFSDKENFRKKIDSIYKSHRKKIRKPLSYSAMRKWIEKGHHTICYPNLEADDAIGLLATGEHKDNCVIVSGDKDMRTIPSWQVCIIDDQIEYVDEQLADYNFCTQTLTGDQTDGYKGLVGCGAVKASRVLLDKKDLPNCWEAVIKEYVRNKYSIDDAYHQARLARILRDGEYNYKTHEVKLWDYNYEQFRNTEENRKAS